LDEPRLNGFDSVELLSRPIRVSRETVARHRLERRNLALMLAINLAGPHDEIPLLVFDEIDTTRGENRSRIGTKMQTLCRDHQ